MSKRFMWTSQGTLAVGIKASNSGLKYVVSQLEKESYKYSVNKVSTGECYLWDSLTDTVSPIDTFGLIIDGMEYSSNRVLSESEKVEVASVSKCAKKWIDQKLSA